ncbi:hypothetical protein J6R97_00185 [bacterium]|nr:hypothetical protein [bacterium]
MIDEADRLSYTNKLKALIAKLARSGSLMIACLFVPSSPYLYPIDGYKA